MNSVRHNKTWDLVELPKNRHALLCKCLYRLKETSDSVSPKFKAKIGAKGFQQVYNVEFGKIFSLVVKMTTLRLLLDVVAVEYLELIQLDIKTSFLAGDLKEEIVEKWVSATTEIQTQGERKQKTKNALT